MDQSIMPSGEPECWQPVVGYEGYYEVSDQGQVRRILRQPDRARRRRGTVRKQFIHHGHLILRLYRASKGRSFRVHTLVAEAFIGPCPEGMEVLHGPGGRLDNRLVNLSYGTHSQNNGLDKYRDGTMTLGIRNGAAKLDDSTVRQIRARWTAGETKKSLAREFGVTDRTVRLVVDRVTWQHVA